MIEWKHHYWRTWTVKPLITYAIMGPNADGIHPKFDADMLETWRLKGLWHPFSQNSDENSS